MTNNKTNQVPRYPDVTVQLSGRDGNAFSIMGAVTKALRDSDHDATEAEISTFMDEAMSGDYDHLLRTCMRWVNVI